MGQVSIFASELAKRTSNPYASWHKVDLHNHSPASFDYEGDPLTAVEESAAAINESGLSVVMFTDHGRLPDDKFVQEVAKRTKALILRGVEFNIFADAFGKSDSKIHREAFFHLLVGFDPDIQYGAQFWVDSVYQKCGREKRRLGSIEIEGVKGGISAVLDVLEEGNAIVIPAHLHSDNNAFKTRSIDDIYDDEQFLSLVPRFTALEVLKLKTASFFDGEHAQTKMLEATCIRSSDAHDPKRLGVRPTFVRMQGVNFAELKASLKLRSRVSLETPKEPDAYVAGVHVRGSYLSDLWLSLSPHCNVFIGVKGSGKTAVLECIRFVLGVEVPRTSADQVKAHLSHILGAGGTVRALLKRADGSQVVVQRSMANPDRFELLFDDDRTELLSQVQAIGFAAQILGWHEIEHAATDSSVRRKYLDAIAGPQEIAQIEAEATKLAEDIKYEHDQAASRHQTFRTLHEQVEAKEQLRKGLQELRDADLIELKTKYEHAVSHKDQLKTALVSLSAARRDAPAKLASVLPFGRPFLPGTSPIEAPISIARGSFEALLNEVEGFGSSLQIRLDELERAASKSSEDVESAFAAFASQYTEAVGKLSEEQQRLLASHRQVMDQTRDLPALRLQLAQAKGEVEAHLARLIDMCGRVTELLQTRTNLRRKKLEKFQTLVAASKVRLELLTMRQSDLMESYSAKYKDGFGVLGTIQSQFGANSLHERLKVAYQSLLRDLVNGYSGHFKQPEFSYYLSVFEDDDLAISFDPSPIGSSGEYRSIDQLSAGQRCTAMFPILLKLKYGPLVIDQPEDNLDNRHIASIVSPAITTDKADRQIIMTSHNANLLVLSDPENVVVFEGQGNAGSVVAQGFLATRTSVVTQYVLDILDGGERALELRYAKYGRRAVAQ